MKRVIYMKKKQSKQNITFIKDEIKGKPPLFKKDKVYVANGLPASSQPARTKYVFDSSDVNETTYLLSY